MERILGSIVDEKSVDDMMHITHQDEYMQKEDGFLGFHFLESLLPIEINRLTEHTALCAILEKNHPQLSTRLYAILKGFGLDPGLLARARKERLRKTEHDLLMFSFVAGLESFALDPDLDIKQNLLNGLLYSNPGYEEILNELGSEKGKVISLLNKDFVVKSGKQNVSFNIAIGWISDRPETHLATATSSLKNIQIVGHFALSKVGVTIARILEKNVSLSDYRNFSNDLRSLDSVAGGYQGRIVRTVLLSTQDLNEDVIDFAKHSGNWPILKRKSTPISLIVQRESGYNVAFAG